jgi:hypothetical protein
MDHAEEKKSHDLQKPFYVIPAIYLSSPPNICSYRRPARCQPNHVSLIGDPAAASAVLKDPRHSRRSGQYMFH